MSCNTIDFWNGQLAIVCSRGSRRRRQSCGFCTREATLLCDFPRAAKGKTCDRPLCEEHSTKKGGGDLCPDHAAKWPGAGAAQEETSVR